MSCPFQFLRKLGEVFHLQGRRVVGSLKDLQNGAAVIVLNEWRTFVAGDHPLQQDADLDFAEKLRT